jgi:CBS domain-containing protein
MDLRVKQSPERATPDYQQQAPHVSEKSPRSVRPSDRTTGSAMSQEQPTSHTAQAESIESFLLYLIRNSLESNLPRKTTGSISVWKHNHIVCCHKTDKVPAVFKTLVVEGLLSVPVLDKHHKYIGMVDLLDMVIFTIDLFGETNGPAGTKQSWVDFLEKEKKFHEATIRDVMQERSKTPRGVDLYRPIMRGFSLFHAFEMMARTVHRRAAVVDERNDVVGISTTSMFVSLISQNMWQLSGLRDMQIKEFKSELVQKVEAVRDTCKVIDAFRIMTEKNITGLAVVNARGVLVDTLSVRDLRGIGTDAEKYHRLWYEVAFFKDLTREEFKKQTPKNPVFVTVEDTFEKLVKVFEDGNIHRIWVAEIDKSDGLPRPVSVISQRDLLLCILKKAGAC